MIRELAIYEEALDKVEATEELLLSTLTFADPAPSDTPRPNTYASTFLIIAPEGFVAGMALFYHTYSTWRARPGIYLEDLFVRPAYRRRGYATLLIQELAHEAQRIDGRRVEWSCLKWNESALKFYRGLGAVEMEEWVGLRVDGQALDRLRTAAGATQGG
jgi:ribosomal protein S18 acetylase RimI-like enzyme